MSESRKIKIKEDGPIRRTLGKVLFAWQLHNPIARLVFKLGLTKGMEKDYPAGTMALSLAHDDAYALDNFKYGLFTIPYLFFGFLGAGMFFDVLALVASGMPDAVLRLSTGTLVDAGGPIYVNQLKAWFRFFPATITAALSLPLFLIASIIAAARTGITARKEIQALEQAYFAAMAAKKPTLQAGHQAQVATSQEAEAAVKTYFSLRQKYEEAKGSDGSEKDKTMKERADAFEKVAAAILPVEYPNVSFTQLGLKEKFNVRPDASEEEKKNVSGDGGCDVRGIYIGNEEEFYFVAVSVKDWATNSPVEHARDIVGVAQDRRFAVLRMTKDVEIEDNVAGTVSKKIIQKGTIFARVLNFGDNAPAVVYVENRTIELPAGSYQLAKPKACVFAHNFTQAAIEFAEHQSIPLRLIRFDEVIAKTGLGLGASASIKEENT